MNNQIPETPLISLPETEYEQVPARRRGTKLVMAWVAIDSSAEKNGGKKKVLGPPGSFSGSGNLEFVDNMTGQKQIVPVNFPIANCSSFDEAFGAFDDAMQLHVKLLNAQQQMMQQQAVAAQAAQMRKSQIDNAVRGIEIARR